MKKQRPVLVRFLYVLIIMLLILAGSDRVFADTEKRVLFISSYSQSFITVPDQIKGIRSVLDEQKISLDIEYMDTKRFSEEQNIENFYHTLQYKLNKSPSYDAIIVGDDAALQFAMDHQEELFDQLPIIFFGINDKERAQIADANPYMAGSIEETSLVENIEIAHQFNPEAKKIMAIVDDTLTGQGDQKQFEEACKSFPNLESEVLNVSEYSFEEFEKILEAIDDETILLFLSMNQDKTGNYVNLTDQFKLIREHTSVPVYRASVGGVGEGLIGGKMISYEDFGKDAAHLAVSILSGTPVETITAVSSTPYYYKFDYALIQKYGISDRLIPEGAVLINKELGIFEQYRNYILATLGIIALLSVFTIILVIDNIKRRIIQKELERNHVELKETYEALEASEEELKSQYDQIQEQVEEMNSLYQKLDTAIQSTNSVVWDLNLDSNELIISGNISRLMKKQIYPRMYVYDAIEILFDQEFRPKIVQELQRCINHVCSEIYVEARVAGEQNIWILIRGQRLQNTSKTENRILGIFLDVSAMKEKEEYIEYLANHDYLTNLPNRMNFMQKLSVQLKSQSSGAVFLLDIDNFKGINDTLGHVYGDQLLQQIANRLKSITDDNMLIARLGGDEFLVLITDVLDLDLIEQYASKVKATFDEAFVLNSNENYINISMGITCFPNDSSDLNQLIMNADTAMYKVKHDGKNRYIYYHQDMKDEIKSKIEVENILRQAIKEDGFSLFYQPQVELTSGKTVGFEALLRLKNYKISPGVFIPVAEETGLIIPIGRWVAKEVIRQITSWREKGFQLKPVAINYSSKQMHDQGYCDYLKKLMDSNELSTDWVEIEITESVLVESNERTMEFLQKLKKEGFRIALDDFGTGYSSLNYLTFIPVDKIKLDKSINDRFLEYENTQVMDNLISLMHSLNLKIVAEGIDHTDKCTKLKNGSCDMIQGYLFSRPLPIGEIEVIYDKEYDI